MQVRIVVLLEQFYIVLFRHEDALFCSMCIFFLTFIANNLIYESPVLFTRSCTQFDVRENLHMKNATKKAAKKAPAKKAAAKKKK